MTTYTEAAKTLKTRGMKCLKGSRAGREYWGFGADDVMLDHSATITHLGGGDYHVSDFSDLRKEG